MPGSALSNWRSRAMVAGGRVTTRVKAWKPSTNSRLVERRTSYAAPVLYILSSSLPGGPE
jgi:hypothetical protein